MFVDGKYLNCSTLMKAAPTKLPCSFHKLVGMEQWSWESPCEWFLQNADGEEKRRCDWWWDYAAAGGNFKR